MYKGEKVLVMVFYLNDLNNSEGLKEKCHSQHDFGFPSGDPPSVREQLAPLFLHVEPRLMKWRVRLIKSTLGLQEAFFLKELKHFVRGVLWVLGFFKEIIEFIEIIEII